MATPTTLLRSLLHSVRERAPVPLTSDLQARSNTGLGVQDWTTGPTSHGVAGRHRHVATDHPDPVDAAPSTEEPTISEPDHAPPGVPPDRPQSEPQPAPSKAIPPRFGRAQVLAVANQKGGVGKTTTAVSVAAAMAQKRLRTLLIDLDPQGNASSGIGCRPGSDDLTIYDVLVGSETTAEEAIVATSVPNLLLLPSNIDLAGAEIELVSAFSREQQLRRALEPLRDQLDVIVIDCPPSLGLLTINALTAADAMVVPIQCEYYALEGLSALRRNADLVRSSLNRDLDILGFVLTMMDGRTRLSQQVVDEVREHFGDKVFTTRIPRTVRLAEAPGFGEPITHFDPASKGAVAYRRLAGEILDRLARSTQPPPAAPTAPSSTGVRT